MKSNLLMNFSIDRENRKILVEREFAAPVEKVWAAWTESHLLDQWWAPKPWKIQTRTMDFREGGYWLYAMVGPEGEEHWCREDFTSIVPGKSYSSMDTFCDRDGNIDQTFPKAYWTVRFRDLQDTTAVNIEIAYDKLEDLEKYIEMGFREGFTSAMENLDEIFSSN
jgi:uncharacterized protein YndB with AHSA1/START domain